MCLRRFGFGFGFAPVAFGTTGGASGMTVATVSFGPPRHMPDDG